ncbi:MAG TPA: ABC transporter ATP-binding protein, partial [Propionibacteriaceae bacterium]|nr:ABC transporter ATP-binding protein [Propionibacteriaceae bacterium]
MSSNGQVTPAPAPAKAPERPKYGPTGGMGRMMGPGQGTGEKSLNFLSSFKRLLGHLAPERGVLIGVLVLAIVGIAFNVIGPLLLGRATDVIFTGAIGASLPAGLTKEQAVAELRADGNNTF